jgi:hypothetical protein
MPRMNDRARAAAVAGGLLAGAAGALAAAQSKAANDMHTPNAIAGRVTNAAGQPVPGVGVTLVERDEFRGRTRFHPALANLRVATNPGGEYRIDGVRLGQYFVAAIPQNPGLDANGRPNRAGFGVTYHPSAKTAAEATPVMVDVRGGPVTADITLRNVPLAVVAGTVVDHVAPLRMVRATGRVIVDAAVRAALQPGTISVAGNPVSFDGNPGPQRAGRVSDDLTFEFRTWPGPGWVRVGLESPQWKVKSIRYKGTDLTNEGSIDFVEGQDISGIEIELVKAGG